MHRLHLLRGYHVWILQVLHEVLNLISEEPIRFNSPLFFLLLLDLETTDFIADICLKSHDLLSHSLIENHNVLNKVHFHLSALAVKFVDALTDFLILNSDST